MKRLLLFLMLCSFYSTAQQTKLAVSVYGHVQDQQTREPIPYVTISIKDKALKSIVSTITDEKGMFKLQAVPDENSSIQFSLMGYQTILKSWQTATGTKEINMGIIHLEVDSRLLKEISITTDKSAISLKLDKKVFETGKDILSQTGFANDLLGNVPSVSVSPTGAVSLRGNSQVLVLINGRRSGISLDQLPADQIQSVEVISNPSSRYDAAGSAGVINIILKKNKVAGVNGQLRLVGGIPNETRIMPSLNYKSNKINLFSTFGIRLSDYVGLYTTKQKTQSGSTTTLLDQRQDENRHDDARMLYLGADFNIDTHNTLTAAFLKNATNDHDRTRLKYDYADSSLYRSGESWEKRNYNQLEFNYTKTFQRTGKKFTIDMQYDFWNSDKDWALKTSKLFPAPADLPGIRTSSVGASKDLLVQTDFVQPLDSLSNLELGLKMENRKVTSAFKAEQQDDQQWNVIENIDNKLAYNELIGSAYAQYNKKTGKFGYQIGLRTELTKIRVDDEIGSYHQDKSYARIFPTLNLSYQLSAGNNFQGSYSRRINRPSLNLLYPFNELTDFNARFIGNPDLNPSFAHVFELGYLKHWNTLTLNPSIYYQNNSNIINEYTYRNANGTLITTPVNIEGEIRKGMELSVLYNPMKWLKLNFELNAYTFKQTGNYETQNFDYSGKTLTSRIGSQFRLPNLFNLQCRYNFTGAKSNAQTYTAAIHNIDLGASKNLFKDKASLLFDVTNAFNLSSYNTKTTGAGYQLSQISRPNAARYRITFVYRLNLKENQAMRQAKTGNRG